MDTTDGALMHALASHLFPLPRSLSGDGVRQTFARLQRELPGLETVEVPSGTVCFDWTVPLEWNIREAFVEGPEGERILDFRHNMLHVMGYSLPVDKVLDLQELQEHLYSLPEQPGVIPYVTSYYAPRWGFCLSHAQRMNLKPGKYRVKIDSTLAEGSLTYGELLLPGKEKEEILLSTYVCHPSLANDNLSGPVLLSALGRWLRTKERRFSHRLVFVPETIGAVAYINRNFEVLKERTIAGFVLTCVGDENGFSFLPSRRGNTLVDRICRHVLHYAVGEYREYSFLDRGSDERQYCSPGVDLPVASIMRSKYGEYPEYHTSADDLSFVTPRGLQESFEIYQKCLDALERNEVYRTACCCEPQLGKRGLYPTLSRKDSANEVRMMMNLLALADGETNLLDIAERLNVGMWELYSLVDTLAAHGLLLRVQMR